MRIGFTGTQVGMSGDQAHEFISKLTSLGVHEFHHGDCIGADAEAHDLVRTFFPAVRIVIHPPIYNTKRAFKLGDVILDPHDYLTRNKHIVRETECMVATPSSDVEEIRSGTWSTVRYARKTQKVVFVLKR